MCISRQCKCSASEEGLVDEIEYSLPDLESLLLCSADSDCDSRSCSVLGSNPNRSSVASKLRSRTFPKLANWRFIA